MSEKQDYNIIPMLDNACKIINVISNNNGEAGISAIAKTTGLSKSTIFRILATLQKWDMVQKNEENDKYRLGIFFLKAGEQIKCSLDLNEVSRSIRKKLAEETGETVNLGVPYEKEALILDSISGEASILVSRLEPLFPLYCSGIGKILLQNFSEDEIRQYYNQENIKQKTMRTIMDGEEMIRAVNEIKEKGYSEDDEEYEYGLLCMAAPVYDRNNKIIAGVSISGPKSRIEYKGREKMVQLLQTAAKEISKKMGHEI